MGNLAIEWLHGKERETKRRSNRKVLQYKNAQAQINSSSKYLNTEMIEFELLT